MIVLTSRPEALVHPRASRWSFAATLGLVALGVQIGMPRFRLARQLRLPLAWRCGVDGEIADPGAGVLWCRVGDHAYAPFISIS